MPKFNGQILPELPFWDYVQYPVALICVYSEGFASLAYVDKQAYLVDLGDGEWLYTLNQTSLDAYDDEKMLYARQYVVALEEPVSETLATLFPGINATGWLEQPWDQQDQNIPSGSYYGLSCGPNPHWSNETLRDESGNVVLKGSGITYFWVELQDWLAGFVMALAGKPLPCGAKAQTGKE